MLESEYTENLFQSIDTIIAERIKRLPYDQTSIMEITDATQAEFGIYKVSPNGTFIETVYSDNPTYQVGDKVYVMSMPGNRRFIIGLYLRNDNISRINRIFETNLANNPMKLIEYNQQNQNNIMAIKDNENKYILKPNGMPYTVEEFTKLSDAARDDLIINKTNVINMRVSLLNHEMNLKSVKAEIETNFLQAMTRLLSQGEEKAAKQLEQNVIEALNKIDDELMYIQQALEKIDNE